MHVEIAAETSDGTLVGVGRVLDDGGLYASVWDLIVHPEWRGKGIGTSLVERALEECQDRRLVALRFEHSLTIGVPGQEAREPSEY